MGFPTDLRRERNYFRERSETTGFCNGIFFLWGKTWILKCYVGWVGVSDNPLSLLFCRISLQLPYMLSAIGAASQNGDVINQQAIGFIWGFRMWTKQTAPTSANKSSYQDPRQFGRCIDNDPKFDSRQEHRFFSSTSLPDRLSGGYRGPFSGDKAAVRETGHSRPSNAEVKNTCFHCFIYVQDVLLKLSTVASCTSSFCTELGWTDAS
jgi:hypothetical protein